MSFLIPSLALSVVSLLSSLFLILRIIIPILPPLPISSRVPPKEFGLPNFRSLSLTDKSHLWLAISDLIALAFFVWQAITETFSPSINPNISRDSASAVRVWIALTFRQSVLFIIVALVLLHIRLGQSFSFGRFHWRILVPALLICLISISVTCILSQVGVESFIPGVVAFTATTAVLSTAAFTWLFGTLTTIRRNLSVNNDFNDPWPPISSEKRPRPSFATEEIDAFKDGSSWITSNASSHRRSLSAFSFSTYHSVTSSAHISSRFNVYDAITGSYPSIPPKSSFWFNPAIPGNAHLASSSIPPVPPLPSPYRNVDTHIYTESADPFRSDFPQSVGSQGSWLTEPASSQESLAAWSFPTTRPNTPERISAISTRNSSPAPTAVFREASPALSSAQVLGGYGYSPTPISLSNAEKAVSAPSLTADPYQSLNISVRNLFMWLSNIWLPMAFSLSYLAIISSNQQSLPAVAPFLMALSVTLSSPLLVLNILSKSSLPMPSDLFDAHPESSILPTSIRPTTSRYKRSGSMTIVEDRRSGDVWISKGDAIDGKSKFGRALGLLAPKPKLSVLPLESGQTEDGEITPPLPMQTEEQTNDTFSSHSEMSAELGRRHGDNRTSSRFSGADDSVALTTRIMTAQRHYSALATTVVISPSKEDTATAFTTSRPARRFSHLRARSTTSISQSNKATVSSVQAPITPPPSIPLPPTPPRQDGRKVYQISSTDGINEIDSLSAGLLPLLVPGLRIGSDMTTKDSMSSSKSPKLQVTESSSSFSSPEIHSTPARNISRSKKRSKHYSLPSLGLGKAGAHSLNAWKEDITGALIRKATYINEDGRHDVALSGSSPPDSPNYLRTVHEEEEYRKSDSGEEERVLDLKAHSPETNNIPSDLDAARMSIATLVASVDFIPSSAASTSTLFRDIVPAAESTPREQRQNLARARDSSTSSRRSSIVYIRSDDNAVLDDSSAKPYTIRRLQIKPKANKMIKRTSDGLDSPGLRQFSLLRDKDINRNDTQSSTFKPLNLARKRGQDENDVSPSYNLARSATSKARALLRKKEVLPQVVVRPPSTSDGLIFGLSPR